MGDTFTGLVEAFPCRTEQSKEVVEALVQETIPHFSLPRGIQSDNVPAFWVAVAQGVSQALGNEFTLAMNYTAFTLCLETSILRESRENK